MDAEYVVVVVLSAMVAFLVGAVLYFSALLSVERRERTMLARRCEQLEADLDREREGRWK